jgi:hypothetical protein
MGGVWNRGRREEPEERPKMLLQISGYDGGWMKR